MEMELTGADSGIEMIPRQRAIKIPRLKIPGRIDARLGENFLPHIEAQLVQLFFIKLAANLCRTLNLFVARYNRFLCLALD